MELIPVIDWKKVDPDGIAVNLATKSPVDFKLGAIICNKRGRVVAWGYNTLKSHPTFGSGFLKTLHAESAALYCAHKLGIDVKGMSMFIFRRNNCISKPCKDCQKLLKSYGIRKVYYSCKEAARDKRALL